MFDHTRGLCCSLGIGYVCACAVAMGADWEKEVQRFIDAKIDPELIWGKSYQQCLEILPLPVKPPRRKFEIDADLSPGDLIASHHSESAIEFLAKQGILRQQETIQQPEYLYDVNNLPSRQRGV